MSQSSNRSVYLSPPLLILLLSIVIMNTLIVSVSSFTTRTATRIGTSSRNAGRNGNGNGVRALSTSSSTSLQVSAFGTNSNYQPRSTSTVSSRIQNVKQNIVRSSSVAEFWKNDFRSSRCGSTTTSTTNSTTRLYSSKVSEASTNTNITNDESVEVETSSSSSSKSSPSPISTLSNFLDEHQSDPASYQIPPFQKGDDVLTNLPKGQRIVSFGDVHGDILALYKFLQASQLLHPTKSTITNPIWDGGDAILVQCGDILDRGAEELFCLRYLASLARQAPAQGGKVILLHGNHEALNANGLFQYADPKGNEEIEVVFGKDMDGTKSDGSPRWRLQYAGNQPTRWAAFEPNGWLAEPMYGHMSVSVIVGKTLFVHAGLTKDHLVKYNGIEGMNTECRDWFTKEYPSDLQNDDGMKFTSVQEVIANANLRARTASQTMPECLGGGIGAASPVWMRDYSSPSDTVPKNPQKAQTMIDDCFDELKKEYDVDVQRMVMGHTPQRHINSALKGKAWRVDVGASKGVLGNIPEVLEIIHEGGENGEDIINILTVEGHRIPSAERQTLELPF